MNTPSISFSFSFLNNLNEGFRIFVTGAIIGGYSLVLYELFPEFLFNPNFALPYFVIPMVALCLILIVLPRIKKGKSSSPTTSAEESTGDEILDEIISEGNSDQQIVQEVGPQQDVQQTSPEKMSESSEGITLDPAAVGGENPELEKLLADSSTGDGDSKTVSADSTLGSSSSYGLNEGMVRDMIDQKFEPIEKDLSSFKKDLNKIKEDMKITKENVDSLTESFEGTLTDMKAFQAEIANPLNFMRKYFESIDIKNLSDPSLPLKQMTHDVSASSSGLPNQPIMNGPQVQQNLPNQNANQYPPNTNPQQIGTNPNIVPEKASQPSSEKITEMESIEKGTDMDNPMDSVMKPLFSGNLSVSNLMAIVELAGEMLKENGDDCIDLLIEQCKLMGLKDEDESTIYNIIDMLKKSGMNIEDTLIQLYKFAKIVGINDKEADAHYAKLLANTKEQNSEDNAGEPD